MFIMSSSTSSTTGRLNSKVAIITGSSSGLGRTIAILYAREGASIVCADLRPTARKEIAAEAEINTHDIIQQAGGKAIFVKTDVGDAKEMEALVARAVDEYGRLDMHVSRTSPV
jgi:NAD(P)-dependent dehydrogenase (short-subunit alcohol dehydrogenase family)